MNSTARTARLAREANSLKERPPWGITCTPKTDGVYDSFSATLRGPKGSPYECGIFKLSIAIPERYPFEPPQMLFKTMIYHPNIDPGK